MRGAIIDVLRAPWLPGPAPETAEQLRWSRLSATRRLGTALGATLVMAVVITVTYHWRALLPLSAIDEANRAAARNLILQGLGGIIIFLLARRLVGGLAPLGFCWAGAGVSLALSVPMVLLELLGFQLGAPPSVERLALNLTLGLVVACAEEGFGRGLLVTVLGGGRHAALAVLGSSVLFAYLHLPAYWGVYGLGEATLRCAWSAAFSATFALIRLRSGSLVGPIAFHVVDDVRNLFAARGVSSGDGGVDAKPLIVGCVVAAIYWLACHRAIASPASKALQSQSPGIGSKTVTRPENSLT
jgi:membrane protease YdiL (CAAX protease family)